MGEDARDVAKAIVDSIGGVCLTDMIPGGKALKALKVGKRTRRLVEKMRKMQKTSEKANKALDKQLDSLARVEYLMTREDEGVVEEMAEDKASFLNEIYDMQCMNPFKGEPVYKVTLQFSGSSHAPVHATVLVTALVALLRY